LLSLFEEVECDPETCRISAEELRRGLSRLGLPCTPTLVDDIFAAADRNSDGLLDYGELLKYATEREAQVSLTFARIARNGRIKPDDLKGALVEMGLQVSDEQAAGFFAALDREQTGRVTLQEFERFCWLLPRVNVRAAFESWVRNTPLDSGQEPGLSSLLGDPTGQPSEPPVGRPAPPSSPLIILASGALAGVVSRTATAPLDRLKVGA
jgi:solute carrier family 25 phosphate transporter 23/24/25/41